MVSLARAYDDAVVAGAGPQRRGLAASAIGFLPWIARGPLIGFQEEAA